MRCKLSYLGKKITHHEKIKGSEICGADAISGPTGNHLFSSPSYYHMGTGIVMSVAAHALFVH